MLACQPLCSNIFKGIPKLSASNCDDCFADPNLEACKCQVKCDDGYKASDGQSDWAFACDLQTGAFPEPPLCLSNEFTQVKQYCAAPDAQGGKVAVAAGCRSCSNDGGPLLLRSWLCGWI
eukprot:SRR837773.4510.p2 GENE.SRR837773.4510~~SRR837773.4510.p2  ORF type:complete len:120 (+),score=8.01 SRR837773.4510:324-683(+)